MSLTTMLAVRVRRVLTRPLVRRGLVAALALATGLSVASLVHAADAARQSWGTTRTVAVAARALEPGERLDLDAVDRRELPLAAIPAEALDVPPVGALVRQPIAAGEAIIATRLAPDGLTGAAALVPEGWRAVAVPLGPVGAPPLAVGDVVDLLAVTAADPGGAGPARPLVEGARVVDVDDDAATVAVPAGEASRLAVALTQGTIVLALSGA